MLHLANRCNCDTRTFTRGLQQPELLVTASKLLRALCLFLEKLPCRAQPCLRFSFCVLIELACRRKDHRHRQHAGDLRGGPWVHYGARSGVCGGGGDGQEGQQARSSRRRQSLHHHHRDAVPDEQGEAPFCNTSACPQLFCLCLTFEAHSVA